MNGPTQTEQVISLLRTRGETGLTPLEALDLVGSFRLAARISDAKLLIRDDEVIETDSVTRDGKTYARYVLRRRRTPDVEQLGVWGSLR